jgi:hypothetical protein
MPSNDGLQSNTNQAKSPNKLREDTPSSAPKANLTDSTVASTASATSASSELQHQAKAVTQKLASGNIAEAAQSALAGAKDTLESAKSGGNQLLHDARDKAVEALDYVEERGQELGRRTQGALRVSQDYVRRASRSSSRYVGANALPLALIATGLGWLFVNMRSQRRETSEPARLQARPSQTRMSRSSDAEDREWLERATANARGYGRSPV